jgi:hypothetical protein
MGDVSNPEDNDRPRQRGERLRSAGITAVIAVVAVVAAILIVPKFIHEPPNTIDAGSGASTPTTTAPTTTGPTAPFTYQPLWPFRSADEAGAWQAAYAKDHGHEPWHLDADKTALEFTQHFLGYTEVDTVTSRNVDATGAHIGVGFTTEGTLKGTAAILHLAKLGSGSDAPWEVVGTDDGDLTIATPSYGATATSPVTVGGLITGVDENLKVQVRQPTFPGLIGEACCLPAGGENTPWTTTVKFTGATDPVLTMSVSTGGHLKTVERFAVTGVRVG